MAVFKIKGKEMIINKELRKPCEGIWWKTPKNKNIQEYESDISRHGTTTVRFVSKAEKEAWIRALSTSFSEAVSQKTTVIRTVSKEEKEAWEKAACEALLNVFMEEIRPKLYECITEILNKWNEEK